MWAIQVIGRWGGSDAARMYVRAVPLEAAACLVAVAARQHDPLQDLEDVVFESTEDLATPETVLQKLAEIVDPRWHDAVCALAEPLEVEVETAMPLLPQPRWIRNEETHCGWRFAGLPKVAADVYSPKTRDWEIVCKRCAKVLQHKLEAEATTILKTER